MDTFVYSGMELQGNRTDQVRYVDAVERNVGIMERGDPAQLYQLLVDHKRFNDWVVDIGQGGILAVNADRIRVKHLTFLPYPYGQLFTLLLKG